MLRDLVLPFIVLTVLHHKTHNMTHMYKNNLKHYEHALYFATHNIIVSIVANQVVKLPPVMFANKIAHVIICLQMISLPSSIMSTK